MYLKYNEKAAEKGVYVIGSCGFDSIPADMGVLYTRDKLKGDLFKCDLMRKKKCRSCFHLASQSSDAYVETPSVSLFACLYQLIGFNQTW